ncbi:MAG: hypothetical protein HGA83_09920, partial [Bacteroidales bacterium]|nr:hypothetical protein [Bacteroidales bacterium]
KIADSVLVISNGVETKVINMIDVDNTREQQLNIGSVILIAGVIVMILSILKPRIKLAG